MMTISGLQCEYYGVCDCHARLDTNRDTGAAALEVLTAEGWTHEDGVLYCPDCTREKETQAMTIKRPTTNGRARAKLDEAGKGVIAAAVIWHGARRKADEMGISLDQGLTEYTSAEYNAAMELADEMESEALQAVDQLLDLRRSIFQR